MIRQTKDYRIEARAVTPRPKMSLKSPGGQSYVAWIQEDRGESVGENWIVFPLGRTHWASATGPDRQTLQGTCRFLEDVDFLW